MKIGHRGAMGYKLENTLVSIQKAIDLKVDGIEIDVFKIKSGEIVVFHDENVERLTNGYGNIEDYELKDLNKIRLLDGSRIPLLEDVLDIIKDNVFLNIELKGLNTAEQVEILTKNKNVLISSFHWNELRKIKNSNIGVLIEGNPLKAINFAKEINAISINPDYNFLTDKIIEKIHEEGFKIYTWVVNEKFLKNVDGIISDYPDKF